MKHQTGTDHIRSLFILVQIILYVTFLTLDLIGGYNTLSCYIKFTVIVLCFCYALFSKCNNKSISLYLKWALFFTLISDLFILLMDRYLYGVLTFIIVQQLYSLMLCQKKGQNYAVWIILQVFAAGMICYALFLLKVEPDALLVACMFYFICILTNTVRALSTAISDKRDKGMILYAVGMLLFLLCDINVGLFNLTSFIALPDHIYHVIYSISTILMWTFYAPAQVLIALSVRDN